MPNIVIVGLNPREAEGIREIVENVLRGIGKEHGAVTTILPADTKWCDRAYRAPYLIVRDAERKETQMIASVLHARLNMDIEYEEIGFLEAIPASAPPKPTVVA